MKTSWSKMMVYYIRGVIIYELDVVSLQYLTIFVVLLIYFSSACGIGTHIVFKPHLVSANDNEKPFRPHLTSTKSTKIQLQ
jgi:hypothetical protein